MLMDKINVNPDYDLEARDMVNSDSMMDTHPVWKSDAYKFKYLG